MKNLMFLLITGMGAGLVSCKPPSETTKTMTTDAHSSRNSLDWDGIYRGVLPCGDCPGIQKTIILGKDRSYTLKVKYLGKEDSAKVYTGTLNWNSRGNIITLDENGQAASYMVGENTLTQLDKNGSKITGNLANAYVLSKDQYALVEKYWKLVELNGKPVVPDSSFRKEPHILFKEEDNRFAGSGGCNNFSGTYQIGGVNKISLSKVASTQMACAGAVEVETQFLRVLSMADNYNVNGDMLVLNKARMAPLARFKSVVMQ